jgi:glutamate synthase domain-containing protein 1
MATESAVTTDGAHPFSTGPDQCLVHNGSLSNHNNVRRVLKREGIAFETENDTEVAAGYLSWRMREGVGLGEALRPQPRTTSTASTPSSSAPRTASACCATRSPASRR